jgi:hypothetical protein
MAPKGVIGLKGTSAAWIIGSFGRFVISFESWNTGFIGCRVQESYG